MDSPKKPSASYYALLKEIVAGTSLEDQDVGNSVGIELIFDEFTTHIYPHPFDEDRLIIDIVLRQLEVDGVAIDAERLRILHELNGMNRFTTGWMVVLDDVDLIMTQALKISSSHGAEVLERMAEGLNLAERFTSCWDHLGDFLEEFLDSARERENIGEFLRV